MGSRGKSANTSPPSPRARARAREAAGNQRPWPADKVERWLIAKRARSRIGQPGVDPAEAAGRQRFPSQRRGAGLAQVLVEVPQIDRGDALEGIFAQRASAVPDRLAAAPAIFRALPDHSDAPAQGGFVVRPPGLKHVEAV